jgi:hypothetical protein
VIGNSDEHKKIRQNVTTGQNITVWERGGKKQAGNMSDGQNILKQVKEGGHDAN